MSWWPTRPWNETRSPTPSSAASRDSRRYSGSPRRRPAGGPPAMTSSAPGTPGMARTTVSRPLRLTRRLAASTRGAGPRRAAGPSGRNIETSTPHGTTVMPWAGTPRRASSRSSSEEVASTAATSRAIATSMRIRDSGLASRAPWWRRLTTPREWNVWTTGRPCPRAPASAARPLIQKCACTTSGGSRSHRAARYRPNRDMYGSSRSFGSAAGGPAGTCSTVTPRHIRTRSRNDVPSRRV